MNCPVCHEGMELLEHNGRSLHRCISCFGLLVPSKLFNDIAYENGKQLQPLIEISEGTEAVNHKKKKKCPGCSKYMVATNFKWDSEIKIDYCGDCELIWLDSGELRKIHAFIEKEHPDLIDGELHFEIKKISAWFKLVLEKISSNSPLIG